MKPVVSIILVCNTNTNSSCTSPVTLTGLPGFSRKQPRSRLFFWSFQALGEFVNPSALHLSAGKLSTTSALLKRLLLLAISATGVACGPVTPENASTTAITSADTAQSEKAQSEKAGPALIADVAVQNPSDFAREQEQIAILLSDLAVDGNSKALSAWQGNTELPSQLIDRNEDGVVDQIVVSLNLPSAGNVQFSLKAVASTLAIPKLTQAEISHKVGGEWQGKHYVGGTFQNVQSLTPPDQYTDHSEFIRYEGPGIESDKVAYRIYLDWRNGFDIFGNQTGKPVLQQVGLDGYESYHHLAPWGMDLLKVGPSLGAGGFGYWQTPEGAVQGVAKVAQHSVQITNNGPMYSALNIKYQGWQIAGKTLDVTARLSMQAGSRLLHNRLELSAPLDNLAIGLVKHDNTELMTGTLESSGHQYTYLASYGAQSLNNDQLGMALFFKRGKVKTITADSNSHVVVLDAAGEQVDYYLAAAWQGEPNGIKDSNSFKTWLAQQVERLTLTPRVRLKPVHSQNLSKQPLTKASALAWSVAMARSELPRQASQYYWGGWDHERARPTSFEYTTGLLIQSYMALQQVAPDPAFLQVIDKMSDSFVAADGSIHSYELSKYNIDSINSGNVLLRQFEQSKAEKYQKAAALLRQQLATHPKTSNGAYWHKQIYPSQLWLDGVYMAMPFLAHYSALFEQGASWPQVVHEFQIAREQLRDPATGLYYHAWDESKQMNWADPKTGRSSFFWSRGIGWLGMALVDVLDRIPAERTVLRQPLLEMVNELAASLVIYQDAESGVWFQITDKPTATGNYREASGSSMFVYFLAKALNKNYIPAEMYRDATLRAYQGLLNEFVLVEADGTVNLVNMVQVAGLGAGRDGSYRYYMSEPLYRNDSKGTAPFILAGIEVSALLAK